MKRYYVIAIAAAMLIMAAFSACSGEKEIQLPTDAAATAVSSADVSGSDAGSFALDDWYDALDTEGRRMAEVILSSTDAFNAKDKAGYMAAIDRESDAYAETKKYVNYIFKHYGLTAAIDSVEVIKRDGDSASVRVTQTTVSSEQIEEGRTFADAQTVLIHTMTRRGGEWFITSTVVESRRELESGWDALAAFAQGTVSGSDTVSTADVNE